MIGKIAKNITCYLTSPPILEAAVIVERVPALSTVLSCSATTREEANLRKVDLERRMDWTLNCNYIKEQKRMKKTFG
jgi:hypothetical protein